MYTLNLFANLVLVIAMLSNVFMSEIHPQNSSYSFNLNILDCDNIEYLRGCRHEIGHKMDDDLGRPSLTSEFIIATQAYATAQLDLLVVPDDLAIFIRVYPDKNPIELYAGIYAYVEGDISKLPPPLQKFYSNDPVYLDLYDCLAQIGLNICGRSVSFLKG